MSLIHPDTPPTGRALWLRLFAPFALGYYLSYLLRTVNAVISPDLTGELQLSGADLGLLTSTYMFAFALAQLPIGIALDRWGPRRVEAGLLLLTMGGAVLFALGRTLAELAAARAMIGFGVSACLMASMKGFSQWLPPVRLASMTGLIMSAGALGALTASVPVEWVLPLIGWRGVFWCVAVVAGVVAALIFFTTPDKEEAGHGEDLKRALGGVAHVFSGRPLWHMAGHAAFFTGGFMAVQGLWAVPWMMQAAGYSRMLAADHLFVLGVGMLGGQLAIGTFAGELARRGFPPLQLMRVGVGLTIATEALIIAGIGPSLLLWLAFGVFSACGAQMYGVLAGYFVPRLTGRVTTAANLIAFAGAFVIQWGFGVLSDALEAGGYSAALAMRITFAALVAMQAGSYVALLKMPATAERLA